MIRIEVLCHRRAGHVPFRPCFREHVQTPGLGNRSGRSRIALTRLEYTGRRGDADGDRQRRCERKAGAFAEHACRIAEVLYDGVDDVNASRVASLPYLLDASRVRAVRGAGLRQAARPRERAAPFQSGCGAGVRPRARAARRHRAGSSRENGEPEIAEQIAQHVGRSTRLEHEPDRRHQLRPRIRLGPSCSRPRLVSSCNTSRGGCSPSRPTSALIQPRRSRRCREGYIDFCCTSSLSREISWMCAGHAPAVQRGEREAEDQKVQCALRKVQSFVRHAFCGFYSKRTYNPVAQGKCTARSVVST